jgi:hypothetical protein
LTGFIVSIQTLNTARGLHALQNSFGLKNVLEAVTPSDVRPGSTQSKLVGKIVEITNGRRLEVILLIEKKNFRMVPRRNTITVIV